MTALDFAQLGLFFALFFALTPVLGQYMANIFTGRHTYASRLLGWLENLCYVVAKVDPHHEMSWTEYAKNLFWFKFFGFLLLFFFQLAQEILPLNPQNFPAIPWHTAFNTALSFVTNTNWQSYVGEASLSYFVQMIGLTVQNFLSAATGLAVMLALSRGMIRKMSHTIGNFWADMVRSLVYILLPLSVVLAIFLMGEGVVQTLSPYVESITLENVKQTIPLGPVASQVAIKQLGTNGGGFFSANSAHPFENPTGLSNLLEMLAIVLIPAASVLTYGKMIGSQKHGWYLFAAMSILWSIGIIVALCSESFHNPVIDVYPNFEGKESRLGITNSLLWAISTTSTSNGSVNAMISSFSPLAGGMAMANMMGEFGFGGVGVGMCSMIMFVLITIFISGLMVGRTPEYLGKKIEVREMQWVMLAILLPGALILVGSGISCTLPEVLASLSNHGPHGLSEILYAFSSCARNNGSAFAGLNISTPYYNIILGFIMLIARMGIILSSLAIAGLLAKKKITPPSKGTLSTNSILFVILLICVVLIINALTFFPAISLGPIAEHFLMLQGQSF